MPPVMVRIAISLVAEKAIFFRKFRHQLNYKPADVRGYINCVHVLTWYVWNKILLTALPIYSSLNAKGSYCICRIDTIANYAGTISGTINSIY